MNCGLSGTPNVLDWINVLQAGAKGNGTTDDSGAINAVLAAGKIPYLPRTSASYRLSSSLQFSSQIGQRLIGDGPVLSILNADAGVDAIRLGARSQQIENVSITGPGKANAGNGVSILDYYPFWKLINVLIAGMAIAVNNKTLSGSPGGSDAGGIFGSQITTCGIGYLAYGNKDDTPVIATGIGSCDTGIQVDGDGGCYYEGNVLGANTVAGLVSSGSLCVKNGHVEGTPANGISFDVSTNGNLSLIDCAAINGNSGVIDIRCAAGATAYCSGKLPGFSTGRVNSTGQILNTSRAVIAVDYNGGGANFAYNAGAYTVVDTTLPTATIATVGSLVMLIISGGSRDVYLGTKTGASSYAWSRVAPTLAQLFADAGITPAGNSTTTPVTSITTSSGIVTAKS